MSTAPYSYILREAADVADERNDQYGDSIKNFTDIQETLRVISGVNLSIEEIAWTFIATKFARGRKKHKDDNIIDAINYLAILLDFIRKTEARAKEAK